MNHDWLLVETLGDEPAVVAEGASTKDVVPVSTYLRRNPHLMAVQTAIGETVHAGSGLTSITPKNDRVIRTEVVQMSDGRIHGVQLWLGAPDEEPPPPPVVGPLVWDLTEGTATDTPQSLLVSGWDPEKEATHGRAFVDDLPRRDLNPDEAKILSMIIRPEVGVTVSNTWDVTDYRGEQITVGFVARTAPEVFAGGGERLICRAMNWRSVREGSSIQHDLLAQRILAGLAEPGVHRALVDPRHWTLLKWLDEPAPFFDWRAATASAQGVHPDDRSTMSSVTAEFDEGLTSGLLRMVGHHGGWTPVHVTVHRVELGDGVYAGLVAFRRPTDEELASAGLPADEPAHTSRKSFSRRNRSSKR